MKIHINELASPQGNGDVNVWHQIETKCKFMMPSVDQYRDYYISGEGISPTKEKRRAIVYAPVIQDCFCLIHADTLAPLYKLLTKHQPWCWETDQARAI